MFDWIITVFDGLIGFHLTSFLRKFILWFTYVRSIVLYKKVQQNAKQVNSLIQISNEKLFGVYQRR